MNAVLKETTALVAFREFDAKMQEFRQRYDGIVYDLSDPDEERKARSDRLAIGKVISRLDEKHKEIKAPLAEQVMLIDGERKRIKDTLLDIQEKIKSQIRAHEDTIAAHETELQAKVDEIQELAITDNSSSAHISARLEAARAVVVDDSFEHHRANAAFVRFQTITLLETKLSAALKAEAEQAELLRLRKEIEERDQRDRDERIRKEAADKATKEAKARAEEERQQAELNARRAIEDAERKAKDAQLAASRAAQVERERIEREQRQAAAKQEAERREEEAKKANKLHRAKIHSEAKASLMAIGINDALATSLVEAIRDRKIKHIEVRY